MSYRDRTFLSSITITRRLKRNLDLNGAGQISFAELDASVKGWVNYVHYADTWGLRGHLFAAHPVRRPHPASPR